MPVVAPGSARRRSCQKPRQGELLLFFEKAGNAKLPARVHVATAVACNAYLQRRSLALRSDDESEGKDGKLELLTIPSVGVHPRFCFPMLGYKLFYTLTSLTSRFEFAQKTARASLGL
jgi:hypothetical protein